MNKLFPTRILIPAATSAALVSLVGCGVLNLGHVPDTAELAIPPATAPATQPTLAQQTAAEVQRQVDRVNAALDHEGKVGPAAGVGSNAASSNVASSNTATAAVTPAAVTPPVATVVTPAAPASPSTVLVTTAQNPPKAAGGTGDLTAGISAMTAMTASNSSANTANVLPPTGTETDAGMTAANGGSADGSIDPLLDLLRKRIAAHPNQVNYALALELLESAETGKATDPASLSALSQVDQKLLAELVPALQSLAAQPATPTTTLADRAAPLAAAAKKWEAEADLTLPRLALASRVDSYGVYTPVEAKFEYGKRNVVIIYCEVANFTSKAIEETTPPSAGSHGTIYQTRLAQQDTLITEDGLLVWRPNPEEIEDRSRNQRHDFYLVKKLTIPENLAIGKYTLRMSVTDKLSNKISTATIPIEIAGPTVTASK